MTTTSPLLIHGRRPANSFVLPEHKIVYISVTKVACTSLRWMLADLAGEDLESFYRTTAAHQTRLMTIHRNRDHWQHVPQLFNVPPEEVAQMSRDNGWFIFAVIRDPWSRLWSGWQSKFLVRHPSYVELYEHEPWFPRTPKSQDEVIEDFHTFVMAQPWKTNEQLAQDVHFKTQAYSVHPDRINYSKIYDLTDMSSLFADLHTHLQSIGKDKELYTPRANDTPLALIRPVMDNGIADAIQSAYRADFKRWGDRWSLDKVKMGDAWTQDAIRHLNYHVVANQRIGDMRDRARQIKQELWETREELERYKRLGAFWSPRRIARGLRWRLRRVGRRLQSLR
jgi:hypothetical protein